MQMRIRAASALAAVFMGGVLLVAAPASAQSQPCPPGVPPGTPPGRPTSPGSPQSPTQRPAYPPGQCQLQLSRTFAARGGSISAAGAGFVPGEEVTLSIAGIKAKSVTASADGTFATDIVVPAAAPIGATQVTAASATQVLSANFEVIAAGATAKGAAAAAPSTSGALPRTGAELAGLAGAGAGLVGIGAVAVTVARRRRNTTA